MARTFGQFRSSWKLGLNHTQGFGRVHHFSGRVPAEERHPSRHPTADLHSYQNLSWHLLLLHTSQLPSSLPSCSICRKTKTVISSAYAETFALRNPAKRDSTQSRSCRPIPKPTEQRLQSKDIEKRRQGATLPNQQLDCERRPFTCITVYGLWYIILIHFPNSDLNPMVSKSVTKIRWSSQSKALDWSR